MVVDNRRLHVRSGSPAQPPPPPPQPFYAIKITSQLSFFARPVVGAALTLKLREVVTLFVVPPLTPLTSRSLATARTPLLSLPFKRADRHNQFVRRTLKRDKQKTFGRTLVIKHLSEKTCLSVGLFDKIDKSPTEIAG